jgi:hypothetical protein
MIEGLTLYRYFDEEKGLIPYCSLMKKKNLTFLECMLADHNIFSDRLRLNKE